VLLQKSGAVEVEELLMLIPTGLQTLEEFIATGPLVGYAYSYPHKTAYRPFDPPRSIESLWSGENVDSLFLYVHIPFCEVRCGFCNLFTFSQPEQSLPSQYLHSLETQARVLRQSLPGAQFSRVAIGGGTPTHLSLAELESLFGMLREVMGVEGSRIPISIEASPATIDEAKLAFLQSQGVDRLSVGIQSFHEGDLGALGRPQKCATVERSLELIAARRPRVLNLDLIYGGQKQTLESWMASVEHALLFKPEEIYLYPLYIRPLTGLAKPGEEYCGAPLEYYRAARQALLEHGYEQHSFRMFRRQETADSLADAPVYRCQEDGMIGLGCGARSYTRDTHYADRFAVKQSAVLPIIQNYLKQTADDFAYATNGMELSLDERRRRYLITSLLQTEGLCRAHYESYFQTDVLDHYQAEVDQLVEVGFATLTAEQLCLTERGVEYSDAIGPWLYSAEVRLRMEEFAWNLA